MFRKGLKPLEIRVTLNIERLVLYVLIFVLALLSR